MEKNTSMILSWNALYPKAPRTLTSQEEEHIIIIEGNVIETRKLTEKDYLEEGIPFENEPVSDEEAIPEEVLGGDKSLTDREPNDELFFEEQELNEAMEETDTSDLLTAAEDKPDLKVGVRIAVSPDPPIAMKQSTILFEIRNWGTEDAYNVEVGLEIDDEYVGKINVGTVKADYLNYCEITILNVPAGKHKITIVADPDNKIKESNENNNYNYQHFTWVEGTFPDLPDLIANIISPATVSIYPQDRIRPDKEDTGENFVFEVRNNGQKATSQPFLIHIEVRYGNTSLFDANAQVQSSIQANSAARGSFDFSLQHYYDVDKELTFTITVDANNAIKESSESNNVSKRSYKVVYCVHKSTTIPGLRDAKNMIICIDPSAYAANPGDLGLSADIYQGYLNVWDGYSPNVTFTDEFYVATEQKLISELGLTPDIVIKGDFDVDETKPFANTQCNGVKAIIKINLKRAALRSDQENARTLVHEVGHAFQLGHPEFDNISGYYYYAIMRQTGDNYAWDDLTPHDIYNLQKMYE